MIVVLWVIKVKKEGSIKGERLLNEEVIVVSEVNFGSVHIRMTQILVLRDENSNDKISVSRLIRSFIAIGIMVIKKGFRLVVVLVWFVKGAETKLVTAEKNYVGKGVSL